MIYGIEASAALTAIGSSGEGATVFDNSSSLHALTVASQSQADSSTMTISAWARILDYANNPFIVVPAGPHAGFAGSMISINYAGAIRAIFHDAAGTKYVDYGSEYAAEAFSVGQWHHIFASVNTNYGAGAKLKNILLDGIDVYYAADSYDTYTAFDIGINGKSFGVPIETTDAFGNYIELAEVWIAYGQYVAPGDISKFFLGGSPVDLGANGETPTGISPTYYFRGMASSFVNNLGTGAQPTVNGSLSNALTHP